METILSILAIGCGVPVMVGTPWLYISTIRECGFDASCLLVFPAILLLTLTGVALTLFGLGTLT